MIKPTALALALAAALAPAAALAQTPYGYYGYSGAPAAHGRVHHAHLRRTPREARIARPTFGQVPPEDQNTSRDFPRPERLRQDHVHLPGRRGLLIGTFTLCEMATVYSTPISRSKQLGAAIASPES